MCIRMSNGLRSFVVLAALLTCACAASAPGLEGAPEAARQPSVTTDVVYGRKDGLALTLDVYRPAHPNGAGVISIVSGGWQSSVELGGLLAAYRSYHPTFASRSVSSSGRTGWRETENL
jgi:hypothetical protein